MTLKLIAIGALGNMLGPSAQHLNSQKSARYLRILDRHTQGDAKERFREDWRQHGAELVPNLTALVADGAFDGVVICAGKNGDDFAIITALLPLLAQHQRPYFILHLSTVSCHFVQETHTFCQRSQIQYANYPLTGGTKGAQAATMLILCSGDLLLFEKLKPMLHCIGSPKYFGKRIDLAAGTKLIGHMMVFHGLFGLSLAVSSQQQLFDLPNLNKVQADFFDFLNQGAGGTKQWDFTVRPGIVDDNWSQGFLLRHAVIDVIYTIDLLLHQQIPRSLLLALLEVALLFTFLLRQDPESKLCTQALTRLIASSPKERLDTFIEKHLCGLDIRQSLQLCVAALPEAIQQSLMLEPQYVLLR